MAAGVAEVAGVAGVDRRLWELGWTEEMGVKLGLVLEGPDTKLEGIGKLGWVFEHRAGLELELEPDMTEHMTELELD